MTESHIQTDLNNPLLFRTTSENLYQSTLETGELWLRSNKYYQNIEDVARVDKGEGVNSSKVEFPLSLKTDNDVTIDISGDGKLGQAIVPHYIISLHGTSISNTQRVDFGGFTYGVKSLAKLSAQILYEASKIIDVAGYRFGQVAYQNTALMQTQNNNGAILELTDVPPHYLSALNSDVLRKEPIMPFIEQDEWRIVIFTKDFIENDFNKPLKIKVDTEHFYPYIRLTS
jgi:hypothetical protein